MTTPRQHSSIPASIKAKDFTGQRFGRFLVLSQAGRNARNLIQWECVCDCGNTRVVITGSLQSGNTASCGCLKADVLKRRATKHGQATRGERSPTYSSWTAMLARCTRPTAHKWPDYGGRGIKVCEAWFDFKKFFADMGEKPRGLSLDRIDVEGNYEKSNCRWADVVLQAQNHRLQKNNTSGYKGIYVGRNRYFAHIGVRGESKCIGSFPLTSIGLETAKAARLLAEDVYWEESEKKL